MLIILTNAGAALIEAGTGPINIASFQLGSAFGYIPSPTDTAIHGSLIYTGAPSIPVIVNANVVKYSAYLDYDLGPLSFGEMGLFTDTGVLFALAANSVLLSKTNGENGNSIRLDAYLSVVGTNYDMWLDYANTSNQFAMAVLGSVDQLPPSQDALPNAYIISGYSAGQSAFEAYTDRSGLWNFDCYQYANQAMATITGFDSQSVTIAISQFVVGMVPDYTGQIILEFSSGPLYGICRYVSTAVVSGASATLGFDNPIMQMPNVGDTFIVFGRQQLSTTIPNLPIATTTALGAVIVGTTLTVTETGLLNVNAASYPVTSVNDQTGAVNLTAEDIPGLAAVAISGQYTDLIGTPTPYTLPIATTTVLGGVKAPGDSNIVIAGNGTIDLGFSPVKTVNGANPDGSGNVVVTAPAVVGLVTPTKIVNATDFNSLQTCGLYFSLDADASSFLNAPNTTVGGTLDVEPFTTTATGGDVIQRYNQAGNLFFRRYAQSTNTWSPWVTVSTTAALPIATTTTAGAVIVSTGLNVSPTGLLTTQLQTVNGENGPNILLSAADVEAVPESQVGIQGGVATLDIVGSTITPATDPYTYGRLPFYQNTLGVWWNAGTWNASTNAVTLTGQTTTIAGQQLLATGLQIIDIAYDGLDPNGGTSPNLQTVSANGMVYQVTTAGTTSLDGVTTWAVGDLAVVVNDKWIKIAGSSSVGNSYYDVSGGSPGILTASQLLLQHVAVRTITFQANFAGSHGIASVAATASSVLTIAVSGTAAGTITFAAAGTVPTFTTTGGTTLTVNPGQVMTVTAAASPDTTMANVSFTLLGVAT